jgi:hypothetical protein
MKTASAKAKGRRLVAYVRESLLSWAKDLGGTDIVQPATSQPGADLVLSPKAKAIYPYSIECKNQESINIWSALKQAKQNAKDDEMPVVCFTRNREGKVYVAMELEHFLKVSR